MHTVLDEGVGGVVGVNRLLLFQVLLRQVLEVALGEGNVRGDRHLRLVPRDRHHVTKVARLSGDLDAVLQKLLLRSERARRGWRQPNKRPQAVLRQSV